MPIYTYYNTATEEFRDIFQNMKDKHEYFGESGEEDTWVRVFYAPNASIDSKIDPFNPNDFVAKTASKKGSIGDLLDASKELSEKRASSSGGRDPIKEKYFKEYSEKRKGAKHPEQMKTFENNKVKVDYTAK